MNPQIHTFIFVLILSLSAIASKNPLEGLNIQFTKSMSLIPTASSQSAPNKNSEVAHRTAYAITTNTKYNSCSAHYTQTLNVNDPYYLDFIQQLDFDIETKEIKIFAISGQWQPTDANLNVDSMQVTFERAATIAQKAALLSIVCNMQKRTVSSSDTPATNQDRLQSNLKLLEEMGVLFNTKDGQTFTAQQIIQRELVAIERERMRVLMELSKPQFIKSKNL